MRFSQLSAVASVVAAAQAFLLPPEISEADIDIIKTLPFEDAVGIDNRVMEISCPGCPVVTDIEGKMHSTQVESMLQLNFSLSHDNSVDHLMLNGMQIYPIDPRSSQFMEPLTASQMLKASDDTWEYSSTPKLGYSLSVRHPAVSSKKDQIDLVSIHLEIVEVADKFINGIPTVDLKLLETPTGKLMISDAAIAAPLSEISNPTDNDQQCTTIVCKWRAIIADRLSKLKGCGGKAKPAFVSVTNSKDHGHHGGHKRPHGSGSHRPYRHHHRHGGITRFLRGIVMHIFIPVLIGVMVGITASLIGMIVGHIVIFTWRILFRRGQRGQCNKRCSKYTKVEQNDTADEEAKSFLQNQDPPPHYEVVVKEARTAEE
jgi:hypothetical protein